MGRDGGTTDRSVRKGHQHVHTAMMPSVTVPGAARGDSMDGEADREFARLAGEYLDDRAERHPELATSLGDHRFDDRLSDPSEAARPDERRSLDGWAARLDALDLAALSTEHRVDAAMMADSVARRVFE